MLSFYEIVLRNMLFCYVCSISKFQKMSREFKCDHKKAALLSLCRHSKLFDVVHCNNLIRPRSLLANCWEKNAHQYGTNNPHNLTVGVYHI